MAINLAEIEARANKATEGPWVIVLNSGFQCVSSKGVDRDDVCEAFSPRNRADAEFIAHAREDVPALIAEVKKLREERSIAIEFADSKLLLADSLTAENNAIIAENSRLLDVVQAYKTRLGHAEDLLESAQEYEIRGHLYKDIERYFGGRFV